MKTKIIELLKSTGRPGIMKLIEHMEEIGFFTAPCSGGFHLCKVGGLMEHSLNVFQFGYNLPTLIMDDNMNSWKIVTLLHDLGKSGQFGKPNYVPNILASGKVSDKKPFETNKDLLPVPHEIRSIHIASQFIELTEQESYAILMHNALYSDLKYVYSGKETPLSMLLHFADLWSSRVIEGSNE